MRNYRSLKVWDHSISFVIFYSGMGGFPGATMLKNPPANTEDSGDESSIPGSGRSLGGGWQPTPVFLPGESHGQRSLRGHSPWGHKVRHNFFFFFVAASSGLCDLSSVTWDQTQIVGSESIEF